jgi:hypothetical protein
VHTNVHSDAQPATCAPGGAEIAILIDAEVRPAATVSAVVEIYQAAGVADKAVERRVALNGVASVRGAGSTTSAIARSSMYGA